MVLNNNHYDMESSPELPVMFPPPNERQTQPITDASTLSVSTLTTNLSPRANLSPRTNLSPQGHVAIPNQMDDVAQRRPASTLSTLHIITSRISNVPVPPLPNAANPIHDMVELCATRRKRRIIIRREAPNS
eukprot:405856_1